MSRLTILFAGSAALALAATPVQAQHSGHQGHTMPMPKKAEPKKAVPAKKKAAKPAAKKPAAKKAPATKKSETKKPAAKSSADPHAGHDMSAMPQEADPHAGHNMSAVPQEADPHAGHDMSAMPQEADPHAGHDMSAMDSGGPQPAPPPPEALSGPAHAADFVYGAEMERSRAILSREHGGMPAYKVMVERAETRIRNGRDGYALDAEAWFGGDIDKLWLKGELEGNWSEKLDHAEIQALWSHALDPWFDVQAGVRFDPQPGPNRTHLVLGIQGLAPYWWEVDGALFLSDKGELTARAEAEYDLRITQKLILQPRVEANFSAQDIEELGVGSGISEASLGLRLRYQPTPLFAPYVGVEYERAFGQTARYRRDEGEDRGSVNLLAGLRFFF